MASKAPKSKVVIMKEKTAAAAAVKFSDAELFFRVLVIIKYG